jgi:outer membrane lipoprotein SlyB
MSYRSSRHPVHAPQARVAKAQAHKQQLVMRIVGALVGLTVVAGGLLTALQAHAADTKAAKPAATSASAAAASQGTVQAVQAIEVKGKGSGLGVVGGAVLGGLLGNQMGKGTGNTVMTVGGAVAGGYAGNEVEKNVKKHTVFKTTVKLDDGSTHDYTVSHQFAVGAKVHVSGKKLTLAN